MKTRKHGSGLSHKDVVRFSNRLASLASLTSRSEFDFERGWNSACKYFAHELRMYLREIESFHES